MEALRVAVEALGWTEVSTYIQSGNVLFESSAKNRARLESQLSDCIKETFGHEIRSFVYTRAELEQAVAQNVFDPSATPDWQCHLMFLEREPEAARQKALLEQQGSDYKLHIAGTVLYIAYPKAIAGKQRNLNFERLLGVQGTARTWKVIDALIERAS